VDDPPPPLEVATISIDSPSVQLERGAHKVFTATAKDSKGKVVVVPFVWRSSDESVAAVDLNGRLTARDEGLTGLTASSLGVTSSATPVRVVWQGAAKLATLNWTAPNAATPGTPVSDSIRVVAVTRRIAPRLEPRSCSASRPAAAKFPPTKVVANANGIAAVQWTLGPANGLNRVTATIVDDEGAPIPWVNPNVVTFSVTSYKALDVVAWNQQSATILVERSRSSGGTVGRLAWKTEARNSGDVRGERRRTGGVPDRFDRCRRRCLSRRVDAGRRPGRSVAHRDRRERDRSPFTQREPEVRFTSRPRR
jgi:hypothetical protein